MALLKLFQRLACCSSRNYPAAANAERLYEETTIEMAERRGVRIHASHALRLFGEAQGGELPQQRSRSLPAGVHWRIDLTCDVGAGGEGFFDDMPKTAGAVPFD